MAHLEDFEIPSLSTGILMPAMQHQWMCRIENTPSLIAMQAVAMTIGYIPKEFTIVVEQDRDSLTIHHTIKQLIHTPQVQVHVAMIDSFMEEVARLKFDGSTLIKHHFVLDYAETSTVKHTLTFKYDEVTVSNKDTEVKIGCEQDYKHAMAVVSPRG